MGSFSRFSECTEYSEYAPSQQNVDESEDEGEQTAGEKYLAAVLKSKSFRFQRS